MKNIEIRMAANKANIKLWQIAERFKGGMTDYSFSRKLRHELNEADKQQVLTIIAQLSKGRGTNDK